MAQHQDGLMEHEASIAMREVVQAVRQTNRPGKLVIEVEIKPATKGNNALTVSHYVTVKKPKPDKDASIFFTDDECNLSRDNPMQKSLDLRTVPKPEVAEVRKVEAVAVNAVQP